MIPYERKSRIIEFLEQNGKAEVAGLANMLGVVTETIRRDLREIEKQGILLRTHGGAVLREPGAKEYPVLVRVMKNSAEKEKICRRAAAFIDDGELIFIDNSSTLINLIKYIDDRLRVSILTNCVQVLQEYAKLRKENITMICSGGVFNKTNMSLSGDVAGHYPGDLFPAKAFVSCHGVSAGFGFTDGNVLEVGFKREMIGRAEKKFFLLDHTKFGRCGPVRLGDLKICDVLVTDKAPDEGIIQPIFHAHPELELVITG